MQTANFLTTTALLCVLAGSVDADDERDRFSRANCFNNESIEYAFLALPKWRVVFSFHYFYGDGRHYVTENPANLSTCVPGTGVTAMINGLHCWHFYTKEFRHAGVHGLFLSSEPNPDGDLAPGVAVGWSVTGAHHRWLKGPNIFRYRETSATDCNLHPGQVYPSWLQ